MRVIQTPPRGGIGVTGNSFAETPDNETLPCNPLTSPNFRAHPLADRRWKFPLLVLLSVLLFLAASFGRAYGDEPSAFGIDISHYNLVTDPAAIRGNGITFAYVKATEGTGFRDPAFPLHVSQLRGVGIKVGGYHFADGPDCAAEARFFRAALLSQGLLSTGSLVPMLDMESPRLQDTADECVRQFFDTLGSTGMIVYGNLTWWHTYLHPATWGGRKIVGWIARFNGDPGHPGDSAPILAVHQHTDRGTVPGVAGFVDRDALMPGHTLAELVLGGPVVTAPVKRPAPAPVKVTLPTRVVHVVVRGDTLSAIALHWHVTVAAVVTANGIADPDRIFPGERIFKPNRATAARPPASHTYIVRRGDTLSAIANRRRYPGGWPALARHNHLRHPDLIFVGERLSV